MVKDIKEGVLNRISIDEITDLLRRWISIPSRNPPGEERNLALAIAEQLKNWGFEVELHEALPNRPNVIAYLRGEVGKPRLIFNGHIDTVPEGDVSNWTYNPFEGVVVGNRLYGRGAGDQKGGLVAFTIAAKAIKEVNVRLKGDLILTYAAGEETNEPGTKSILVDKGVRGDWGIVTEPTSLKIATAESGLAWFEVLIRGKAAHASRPEVGVNAISKAAKFIKEIEVYSENIKGRIHKLVGYSKCSVTVIHGGLKENIIPDLCRVVIDRRMIPGETIENCTLEIKEILNRIKSLDPEFNYDFKVMKYSESAEIPIDSEIYKALSVSLREIGVEPKPWGTPYTCDVRNFINDAKIPAVTFGPGNIENCHCVDEWIDLNEVLTASKALALTALNLLT
jgi:succinyl-diaminopimelate desuccinylase